MTDKERADRLEQVVIEEYTSSCDSCAHFNYYTRALAYLCKNQDSARYNEWTEDGPGCPLHSELQKLREEGVISKETEKL